MTDTLPASPPTAERTLAYKLMRVTENHAKVRLLVSQRVLYFPRVQGQVYIDQQFSCKTATIATRLAATLEQQLKATPPSIPPTAAAPTPIGPSRSAGLRARLDFFIDVLRRMLGRFTNLRNVGGNGGRS